MNLRSLKNNMQGMIDITIVIAVGIVFAALMVIAYVIWELDGSLDVTAGSSADQSLENITGGFDDAVNLILVAITVFILAIAIAALLMLRGRQ